MNFASPLWLLALPVLAALPFFGAIHRRASLGRQWPLIPRLWASAGGLRHAEGAAHLSRRIALWSGLALCVVALARPRWGSTETRVFGHAREVLIALDLSRSMLAKDVAPSRLERAKVLVSVLLDGLRGERVGLMLFAGTAFLQSPLSPDYEVLREFLPGLDPVYLPQGGTDYADLLRAAIEAFGTDAEADRFLVILSDGESHTDEWRGLIDDLKKRNVRAITLGLGTAKGSLIPTPDGGFLKDERGAAVLTRMNASTLQELASATGGMFQDASGWVDIAALIEATVARAQRGGFNEEVRQRLIERFQWFLTPAVLLLLVSLWRDFPAVPRLRPLRQPDTEAAEPRLAPPPQVRRGHPIASAIALAWVAALLGARPASAQAPPPGAAPQSAPAPQLPHELGPMPGAQPADQLKELLKQVPAKPAPPATDFADIARATLNTAIDPAGFEDPAVRRDVILDGVDAVDAGERRDAKAAPWTDLRDQLRHLLEPSPQQQQQQKQQQDKGSGSRKESQSQNQPQDSSKQNQDQQQQQPQQQDGQNGQDSSSGERKEKATQGQSLSGLTNSAPQKAREPQQPNQPQEKQRVGGKPTQTHQEARANPELAEALRRYEKVRNLDSPARLAHILDELDGRIEEAPDKGKNW